MIEVVKLKCCSHIRFGKRYRAKDTGKSAKASIDDDPIWDSNYHMVAVGPNLDSKSKIKIGLRT